MKKIWRIYAGLIVLFALIFAAANMLLKKNMEDVSAKRNVVINRVMAQLQEGADAVASVEDDGSTGTQEVSGAGNGGNAEAVEYGYDAAAAIKEIYDDRIEEWRAEYPEDALPVRISFVRSQTSGNDALRTAQTEHTKIQMLYAGTELIGIVVFEYEDYKYRNIVSTVNLCMLGCFLATLGFLVWLHARILAPFHKLSEYPERLSKDAMTEKLPETKNRYFGGFIWGVNMLRDKLANDRKRIDRLIRERQTLLTTIAHGIKTPIANIRLYADAICTGLYQEDGQPNEKDREVAEKIDKNAEEIRKLVQEMLTASAEGIVDFEPDAQPFYITELEEYIHEEYANRLKVLRIPCEVRCPDKMLVRSDKNGIIRILSQLLENAIKYGNGAGILVSLEKLEDGYYFTVRNKGKPVPENEIPYLFTSFWRGSNAAGVEGSGIGLFEAKQIALKLSGDILAKGREETGEMEFVLYLPDLDL